MTLPTGLPRPRKRLCRLPDAAPIFVARSSRIIYCVYYAKRPDGTTGRLWLDYVTLSRDGFPNRANDGNRLRLWRPIRGTADPRQRNLYAYGP